MIRPVALAVMSFAVAACATGPGPDPASRTLAPRGEPSAVIAAELAFARAAREKGTWTAFREYATSDAVWPTPGWVNVQTALKGQADPAQAIVWGPDLVWTSCDGSFGFSTGPATYPDGRKTRFATIWQRQNDGEYRWVLDQGFDLEEGYAQPEMIGGRKAECAKGQATRVRQIPRARRGEAWQSGRSDDGTLAWATELAADCRRTLTVTALRDGAMTEVFRRTSSLPANAPSASC
jgi:hypothetical protein